MKQYRVIGTPPCILPLAEYSFSIYGVSSKIKLTLDCYGDYQLHTPYHVSEYADSVDFIGNRIYIHSSPLLVTIQER